MSSNQPGWYPDPSDPRLVRWFDGTSWTHSVRAMPPNAPVEPSSPPTGAHRSRLGPAVGIGIVAALLATGAGVVAWRLLSEPGELTADEYASAYCRLDDAQQSGPSSEEDYFAALQAVMGASANFNAEEEWDRVEAPAFRSFHAAALVKLESNRRWVERTGEFAQDHRLTGPDGAQAQQDLIDWSEIVGTRLVESLAELRALDLNDVAAGAERTYELSYDAIPMLPDSDGARQLDGSFSDRDPSCDFPIVEQD